MVSAADVRISATTVAVDCDVMAWFAVERNFISHRFGTFIRDRSGVKRVQTRYTMVVMNAVPITQSPSSVDDGSRSPRSNNQHPQNSVSGY